MGEGERQETAGKLKEAAGALTGDEERKREGRADQAGGKAKQAGEKLQEAASDAADALKRA
ncbi:CsbD family protein [Miltoncostaea marina]|uniref:CsbD family protein n=1 Tax=Miltoncostaea marina TaxID=2843215 RepID=UPI001C3DF124|nr:CsbD family protein [Miltoncostaea marina]